jgi:hypothetical protein
MNTFASLLAIEPAGVAVLRIAFTIALLLSLGTGVFIYRRRDRLLDCDPEVVNDTPVVRHNRLEGIVFARRADARRPECSLSTLVRLKKEYATTNNFRNARAGHYKCSGLVRNT